MALLDTLFDVDPLVGTVSIADDSRPMVKSVRRRSHSCRARSIDRFRPVRYRREQVSNDVVSPGVIEMDTSEPESKDVKAAGDAVSNPQGPARSSDTRGAIQTLYTSYFRFSFNLISREKELGSWRMSLAMLVALLVASVLVAAAGVSSFRKRELEIAF